MKTMVLCPKSGPIALLLCAACFSLPAWAVEGPGPPVVDLVPENRMGVRGQVRVQQLGWKCDSPWFGKEVAVCRVISAMPEGVRAKLLELIDAMDMKVRHVPVRTGEVRYEGKDKDEGVMINYTTGEVVVGLVKPDRIVRDENMDPVLKGLPATETMMALCLEWMDRIGLDREEFVKDPEVPGGLDIKVGGSTQTGWSTREQKRISYPVNRTVTFKQRIGDFPAYWNGFGGRVQFTIADGGEMALIQFCLREAAPMGEYEVLDRGELERAILEGFCWVEEPFEASKGVVTRIELSAYHGRGSDLQRHFPLVWLIDMEEEGKPDNCVCMAVPALRQHRDKYPVGGEERRETKDE